MSPAARLLLEVGEELARRIVDAWISGKDLKEVSVDEILSLGARNKLRRARALAAAEGRPRGRR